MDVNKYLIKADCSIIDSMKIMDESGNRILFIAEDEKLIAALTDGDVRRWILKNGDLSSPVSAAANYNPKFLTIDQRSDAEEYLRNQKIEAIPIVDDQKKIISIISWNSGEYGLHASEKIDIPVVMMAGGFGTRLYPYTNVLPKPLIPVGELPIAEHIINQFTEAGCNEFYLVVNFKKNMIKAYFSDVAHDYTVEYAEEDEPLGTGGGLSLLKGRINDTFILTNCDILIREDFAKIYKHHKSSGNLITMVCSAKDFKIPYGIVEIDESGEISRLKEKPSLSFLTNTGCYIVEPEVIDELEEHTHIGFPDIIDKYRSQGKKIGIYPVGENAWLDMGELNELDRMKLNLEKK